MVGNLVWTLAVLVHAFLCLMLRKSPSLQYAAVFEMYIWVSIPSDLLLMPADLK